MSQRVALTLLLGLLFPRWGQGQCTVPFISSLDRLMLFHNGRFVEVDPRPPQRMCARSSGVFFVDHQGRLGVYDIHAPGTIVVATHADEVQTCGEQVAWRVADTLRTLRGNTPVVLSTGVDRFQVSDSLVVFVDTMAHELAASWRGQRIPLARAAPGTTGPQWVQGGNTITVFDHAQRRSSFFHHGIEHTLAPHTDVGFAVNGNDIVGYWDEASGTFMGRWNDVTVRLSGTRPLSAQAGDGLLAFVDGTWQLKAWRGAEAVRLTEGVPAQYWVQDKVLLYLWQGRLMLWSAQGPVAVADHVPEKWAVFGDRVVYLDLDRELHEVRTDGARTHLAREPGITRFAVNGDVVVYDSPAGGTVVVCEGQRYTF